MNLKNTKLMTILLGLISCNSINAHHSFAVEFTAEKTIEIEGVVSEIWFRNPHVRYYVDISDNNKVIRWDVRTLTLIHI